MKKKALRDPIYIHVFYASFLNPLMCVLLDIRGLLQGDDRNTVKRTCSSPRSTRQTYAFPLVVVIPKTSVHYNIVCARCTVLEKGIVYHVMLR